MLLIGIVPEFGEDKRITFTAATSAEDVDRDFLSRILGSFLGERTWLAGWAAGTSDGGGGPPPWDWSCSIPWKFGLKSDVFRLARTVKGGKASHELY